MAKATLIKTQRTIQVQKTVKETSGVQLTLTLEEAAAIFLMLGRSKYLFRKTINS